ncbi:MAG: HK97 gp10 family phage protein [gamma proteobacterium symbiont of Taylorina sp.]|nr:HK97 gp10 family phage protein [gamma proteobacterium symbiont of Taylorina sp.]
MIKMELEGAAETIKYLQGLETKQLQKALGSGLTAIARPIKQAFKQNTPVLTGSLRSAIGQKVLSKGKKQRGGLGDDERGLEVGLVNTKRYYARNKHITLPGLAGIIDGGAKPHVIKPSKYNKNGRLKLHGGRFVKSVNHPGVRGNGFLKRSLSAGESQRQELFYQGLRKWIDRQL